LGDFTQEYYDIYPIILTYQELRKELNKIREYRKEDLKNFKSLVRKGKYYKEDQWKLKKEIKAISELLGKVYFREYEIIL